MGVLCQNSILALRGKLFLTRGIRALGHGGPQSVGVLCQMSMWLRGVNIASTQGKSWCHPHNEEWLGRDPNMLFGLGKIAHQRIGPAEKGPS